MGVSGQWQAPANLPPRKDPRYPLYRRLGGPHSWSGQVQKIMPALQFDHQIQPIAICCTDYAILAYT